MDESVKIEILFGKIAIACGYVSEAQVEEAMDVQRRSDDHRHLGRVMIDLGIIDEDRLMTILAIQRENKTIQERTLEARRAAATLGSIALRRGYCNHTQIHECIEEQAKLERFNLFLRLGEVMISRKVLTIAQVSQLLEEQKIVILGCRGCFTQYNVVGYDNQDDIPCPKCGIFLEKPMSVNHVRVDSTIDLTKKPA